MSDLGFNILGAITGAISIIALIPTLAFAILGSLPSSKLKHLEHLYKEMEDEYQNALKHGLISRQKDVIHLRKWSMLYVTGPSSQPGAPHPHWTHRLYHSLESQLVDARLEVYAAKAAWFGELRRWWRGSSRKMHIVCNETYKFPVLVVASDTTDYRHRVNANPRQKSSCRQRRILAASEDVQLVPLTEVKDSDIDAALSAFRSSVPHSPFANYDPLFSSASDGAPPSFTTPPAVVSYHLSGIDEACACSQITQCALIVSSPTRTSGGYCSRECKPTTAASCGSGETSPACRPASDSDVFARWA
ncbi:hypothetical protein C8Q77DRAFT_297346 [Trametes polyzona]|nr:hypothetical protein C8Q77DRAFT_297346 [Trametes polyzona]